MSWLRPIEIAVSWVLVGWHDLLTALGMSAASGLTWALSIIGLVLVIRTLLIPLFVKQIKASRRLQLAQPEMQRIQKKYKGKKDLASRQKMNAEVQEVYKEHGNPFGSCLPVLLQMPIFFGLFRVLNSLDEIANGSHEAIGRLTQEVATQANDSRIFGSGLSDTFLSTDALSTKIIAATLVILMVFSQFYSMRQMMTLNTPKASLEGPMMKNQKTMMYVLPFVFGITGFYFPIGVLLYWFSTNVWTTVQQFVVINRMPSPGTEAERRLNARRAKKGLPPITHGKNKKPDAAPENDASSSDDEEPEAKIPEKSQRVQPKKKSKRKRKK